MFLRDLASGTARVGSLQSSLLRCHGIVQRDSAHLLPSGGIAPRFLPVCFRVATRCFRVALNVKRGCGEMHSCDGINAFSSRLLAAAMLGLHGELNVLVLGLALILECFRIIASESF